MPPKQSLSREVEDEIHDLKEAGQRHGWDTPRIEALFQAFDRWMQHPRFLDPLDDCLLRATLEPDPQRRRPGKQKGRF